MIGQKKLNDNFFHCTDPSNRLLLREECLKHSKQTYNGWCLARMKLIALVSATKFHAQVCGTRKTDWQLPVSGPTGVGKTEARANYPKYWGRLSVLICLNIWNDMVSHYRPLRICF